MRKSPKPKQDQEIPPVAPGSSPDPTFILNFLDNRLRREKAGRAVELTHALVALRERVNSALVALAAGNSVDEHMIVSASGISAMIARWNLSIDLLPVLARVEPDRPRGPNSGMSKDEASSKAAQLFNDGYKSGCAILHEDLYQVGYYSAGHSLFVCAASSLVSFEDAFTRLASVGKSLEQ